MSHQTIPSQPYLQGHWLASPSEWQLASFLIPSVVDCRVVLPGPLTECWEILGRYADASASETVTIEPRFKRANKSGSSDRSIRIARAKDWSSSADFVASLDDRDSASFYSQSPHWPHQLRPGLEPGAMAWISIGSKVRVPEWPVLGLAMPTVDGYERVRDAVEMFVATYPGRVVFGVVDNGSCEVQKSMLEQLAREYSDSVLLCRKEQNVGYGLGCNAGLQELWTNEWIDLFGVCNDDVIPSATCLLELTLTMQSLQNLGRNPGIVGAYSNRVHGAQEVAIGSYKTVSEMLDRAWSWHADRCASATEVAQVRGLLWLQSPDCLSDVGGFDAAFGLGNFEDDDYNFRARLAGYSLWLAGGAFVHHEGSSTFRRLDADYARSIERNLEIICAKWGVTDFAKILEMKIASTAAVYLPLTSEQPTPKHRMIVGGVPVDLVNQASQSEFLGYVATLVGRDQQKRAAVLDALESLSAA